jgi:hypothetical protein
MLPASYGFNGPAARYKISLPLNKIGDCKVPLFVFLRWKADYGFLRCNAQLFVVKNKEICFIIKTVISAIKKYLYRANNIAKIIYKIVGEGFNLKQLHCIIYDTRTIQYILFNGFFLGTPFMTNKRVRNHMKVNADL